MKVLLEFDEATEHWLAPTISLSRNSLKDLKISVLKQWIDLTTGEIEVEFHQLPPNPADLFKEMIKQQSELGIDDLKSADPVIKKRLSELDKGYDEFLRKKMTRRIELLGIPSFAQEVLGFGKRNGRWTTICRFHVLPDENCSADEWLCALPQITVDALNNEFKTSTQQAINYAIDHSPDQAIPPSGELALRLFTKNAAYCLPTNKHWLLAKGYTVDFKQGKGETVFTVHYNKKYLAENDVKGEHLEAYANLAIFNHKLQPVVFSSKPSSQQEG